MGINKNIGYSVFCMHNINLRKFIQCAVYIIVFFITSCHKKQVLLEDNVYYTCSMDPQVMESKPGKCPICKMPLTAVAKNQVQNENEITLSNQQIELGHISLDTLQEHILGDELQLTGTVELNQNQTYTISSRVMGRIEKLYFKEAGEYLPEGSLMYDIYSEEINLSIKELLLSLEKKSTFQNKENDIEKIIQSTRNKLLLYGLTNEQIKVIEENKTIPESIAIYSQKGGYLLTIDIKEGNYIMEGTDIFHLADLSTLWVEAQMYAYNLNKIKQGSIATISFSDFQSLEINSPVSFINPELNSGNQINKVRIEISNPLQQLKPGMQANVSVVVNKIKTLAVSTNSIITDSKGSMVFVKTGENTFKMLMVHTGIEANGYTEIKSGLKKGDIIVNSGAYLIYSEFIIKKGSSNMDGTHEQMGM